METRGESQKTEQTVAGTDNQATGKSKSAIPLPLVTPSPPPPAPVLSAEEQSSVASNTPFVLVSNGVDPPFPIFDLTQLQRKEEPTEGTTIHSGTGFSISRENLKGGATKDERGKPVLQLLTPGPVGKCPEFFSASEDEGQKEYQASDSDSDGPILYTDDDEEDEDEDGSGESKVLSQGGVG